MSTFLSAKNFLLIFTFILGFCFSSFGFQKNNDSISIWIRNSKNTALTIKKRKSFLNKAFKEIEKEKESSYKAKVLNQIAYSYFKATDTATFLKLNEKALKLATKVKDSFVIADTNWSFAEYYMKKMRYEKSYNYHNVAFKYFDKIEKEHEAARMLEKMSFIKGRYKDYTGSEALLFEAIKKFKKLNNNKWLFYCYRSLAHLQLDINKFDKAIFYHEKSTKYLNKIKDNESLIAESYGDFGHTYSKKKEYTKAIFYYNKALKKRTKIENVVRTTTNLCSAKLATGDTTGIEKKLLWGLKIRDSLNIRGDIVNSKIHLSEFYLYKKDTLKAYKYTKEANKIAKEIKNGGDYLTTLEILSQIDKKNAVKYLKRYIQFNDSLIKVERNTQNKFTRIEFETDEFKEETERLSQQLIYIISGGILALLLLGSIYFIRIQKSKNEKLLLEAEQQKATEEVYLLTLQQQAKLEQEKADERNRISQELHDGILGKLFGTRVGLGFLDISEDDITQEQHQKFLDELQEIEKEIRDVSHKLHTNLSSSEVNFTTIVMQLLKEKSTIGNFTYTLSIHKNVSWDKITELAKVHIYRIIQESLQNIVKHAKASKVTLSFTQEKNVLYLEITDNGIGFNTSKKKTGIGVKNMQSRIEKLTGQLEIVSEKEKGTTLKINLPIT